MRYSFTILKPVIGKHYGCRGRMPHDLENKFENNKIKVEICKICGIQVRFKKGYKGRIDNRAYLEAHQRNFAQRGGRTKRLWHKVHEPEELIIKI